MNFREGFLQHKDPIKCLKWLREDLVETCPYTEKYVFTPRGVYKQWPVAAVAYQVILEPRIGQFREFESPRVHTRINSWGLFLVHKLTCGKRESMSWQHSMTNRRAVGLLNPMRDS